MKHQKFYGMILVFCALVTLAGCASTSTFDGSRVKNADSYQLDIKTMNCTDTHTMELEQGDKLKIQFETVKGNLSMKITAPDGTTLYQGDGTVKEFTVEAPMDGAYPIVVVGHKAKGNIYIDAGRVP
ncbi:MAG: PPC domain-containing protein [Lachnospira sp.]